MTTEQNKQLVGKVFNEVINHRNFAALDEIIGPEFVNHGIPGAQTGPDGFRQVVGQFVDAFPDMKVTIDQILGDGDLVATRGHWTGTHKGDFMGIPGTGKQVRADYIDVWKIRDGRAVENWVQMDMVGIMMQLGAMAPPAAAGAAA